jgi:hypothetical protein
VDNLKKQPLVLAQPRVENPFLFVFLHQSILFCSVSD